MVRKLLLIGLINLLVFLCIHILLQHNSIYSHTLGKISSNYQVFGDWQNPDIRKVDKPYLPITNDNLDNWDASIYKCIKENMYADTGCYNKVKGAFFPLFPMVWKIFSFNDIGISLFNYLIFILSVALLVTYFLKTDDSDKLLIYSILIALPSVVVYFIPYTEALFLLCMTIAAIGLMKNRYPMYFIAAVLLAMVRPATIFVVFALMAVEFVSFCVDKNMKTFIKKAVLKIIPFALGYFLSIFIQYLSSSSWTLFRDAGTYWSGGMIQKIKSISDWSKEGFGLSSFAIFFLCLPALAYLAYTVINKKERLKNYTSECLHMNNRFIFLTSLFYLVGIFVFTILTSGGNIHSFSRFTLCSPLFYIAIILFMNYLPSLQKNVVRALCFIPIGLLIIFFSVTDYGGSKFNFSYTGLFAYILMFLFLIFRKRILFKNQVIIATLLILVSLLWNTYLFNMLLSEAWIFT